MLLLAFERKITYVNAISTLSAGHFTINIALFGFLLKMAAVLDEVGKSAEKLVNEEKDEIVDEEDETGAVEASKKKKKKKKKKKAGMLFYCIFGCIFVYASSGINHVFVRIYIYENNAYVYDI